MSAAPATAPAAATMIKEPNLFELSGGGIHVTYATTTFAGPPQFYYHDGSISKLFTGDQIRVTKDPALGTLVSVTILPTVDTGSTTFTLLVPNINLRMSDVANITTVGITTLHKFSIVRPPQGQTEFYTSHALSGTAAFVVA